MVTPGSKASSYSVGVKMRANLTVSADMLRQTRMMVDFTEDSSKFVHLVEEMQQIEDRLLKMRSEVSDLVRPPSIEGVGA